MIGTGVFTSLGFQVMGIKSGFAIIFLWLLGGISALFGALTYAELGSSMPRSGGEYFYLSRIYHRAFGFLAGWISFLVGFAAPVAAASIAFGKYFSTSIDLSPYMPSFISVDFLPKLLAIVVVLLLTFIHSSDKKAGAAFQNIFTTLKILMVIVLIGIGFWFGNTTDISFTADSQAWSDIISPAFAVSIFFVSYSFSGWNAAAYIAGEIKNPSKNIPISLIVGTIIVAILYILLNYVFLTAVPISQLAGQVEVGYLFAGETLGTDGGQVMGGIIALLLLSSISSMVITGPRVTLVVGEDYSLLRWFSIKNKKDIPQRAIIIQAAISVIYILTSTFEQMITFIGFTLNLFTLFTAIGVFVMRKKEPNLKRPYKTLGYPIIPAIFILINLWILVYGLMYKPQEAIAGLVTTAAGLIVYFICEKKQKKINE